MGFDDGELLTVDYCLALGHVLPDDLLQGDDVVVLLCEDLVYSGDMPVTGVGLELDLLPDLQELLQADLDAQQLEGDLDLEDLFIGDGGKA